MIKSEKNSREQAKIAVRRALPEHDWINWTIYHGEREKAQPNAELGLTAELVNKEFQNPTAKFLGRTIRQWSKMIADDSGQQAIFNAFTDESELPIGIARAGFTDDGDPILSHIYVDHRARGRGAGSALVRAGQEWHGGKEVKLRVAEYNLDAQQFYKGLGFVASQEVRPGYMVGNILVPQVEMVHPGV